MKNELHDALKPMRGTNEIDLPKLTFGLGNNLIFYVFYDEGCYWVRIADENMVEDRLTNLDIKWSRAQKLPFWESEKLGSAVKGALIANVRGITDEKIKELFDFFRNSAFDIPNLREDKKSRKWGKKADKGENAKIAELLKTEVQITEEERKIAEEFLKQGDLTNKTAEILSFAIVGERELKMLIFHVSIGAANGTSEGLILCDKSAIGKSHALGRVCSLFPEQRVDQPTSFSEKSLNYIVGNYKGKILRIDEIYGAEEGLADLRVWMSEGRLERWIPVSEDGAGPELQKKKVEGAPVFLTSTTKTLLDEQILTRVWFAFLDPSVDQTKAINIWQAMRAAYPPKKFEHEINQLNRLRAVIKYIFVNAQPVLVWFAPFIEFPTHDVRARRDFPRFLNLIASVALFNMLKRQTITDADGQTYIVATPEDFYTALDIAAPFLETTLKGIDRVALEIYRKIMLTYDAGAEFTCPELARATTDEPQPPSEHTVRRKLGVLVERGYITANYDQRPHKYQRASTEKEQEDARKGVAVVKLRPLGEKEAQEWFKQVFLRTAAQVGGGGDIHTSKKEPDPAFISTICITPPPEACRRSEKVPSGQENGENGAKEAAKPNGTPKEPAISDLKHRLFEAFGINPFKPSQLTDHFTDDECAKLTPAIDDMLERGELVIVFTESGNQAFQLVVKNG